MPKHRLQTVSTSAQVGITGARNLKHVTIGAHTANATALFYNSADDSGTLLLSLSALANRPLEVDLCEVGGLEFPTAMYCKIAGTAAIVYVWYE